MNECFYRGLFLLTVGFASLSRVPAGELNPGAAYAQVYERATNRFAEMALFTPKEPDPSGMSFALAPLILQEISAPVSRSEIPDRFGELELTRHQLRVKVSQPTVYFRADVTRIYKQPHARWTYVWFYPAHRDEPGKAGVEGQGIRLTLDSSGKPAVWEVLSDASGAALIFVSRAVEEAARAQYGQPLPGRIYAVERSLTNSAGVVVPRVIEDGPVAMGPIVYLISGTRSVATLICRCMPAQAAHLTSTTHYRLQSLEESELDHTAANASEPGGRARPAPPRLPTDDKSLDLVLRLPSAF